jgi:DNA replication and repair protein RecF
LEVRDLRNIREAELDLSPGLNVFVGRNAQGKTSLLEAVGLLARGRSFRTEATHTLIRRGSACLRARGRTVEQTRETSLEVEVAVKRRRLLVDGREVGPRAYQGRLDVVVYATDRLRAIRGPMRERRQFIDRSGSVLWPAYRQLVRDYERVTQQRNASLEAGGQALEAWDDRLIEVGAALRQRRGEYVSRLRQALCNGYRPAQEAYDVSIRPESPSTLAEARVALQSELASRRRDELRVRRSLVGPHRDAIAFLVDGVDAAESASAGQARSLLLALTLATMDIYRRERGTSPLALLDDLDSELDDERALALCREVASHGQALVTTAHPGWADRVAEGGRSFQVSAGCVVAAP